MAHRTEPIPASVETTTRPDLDANGADLWLHRALQAAHLEDLLRSLQKWEFRRIDHELAHLRTERLARLKETHLTDLRQRVDQNGHLAEVIQEQAAHIRDEVLPMVTLDSERYGSGQEKLQDFFRRDISIFRAVDPPDQTYRLIDERKIGQLGTTADAIARQSGFIDEAFLDLDFSSEAVAGARRYLEDPAVGHRLAQINPDWLSRWSQAMAFWQNSGPDVESTLSVGCVYTAIGPHSCANKYCLQIKPGDPIAVFDSGSKRLNGLAEGYHLETREGAPHHGFIEIGVLGPVESRPAGPASEQPLATSSCKPSAIEFECSPDRLLAVTDAYQLARSAVSDCIAVIAAATVRPVDDTIQRLDHLRTEQALLAQEQNAAIATYGQSHNSWVRAAAREEVQLEQLAAAEEHLWEEILMLVLLARKR